jgi:hypothetical protein
MGRCLTRNGLPEPPSLCDRTSQPAVTSQFRRGNDSCASLKQALGHLTLLLCHTKEGPLAAKSELGDGSLAIIVATVATPATELLINCSIALLQLSLRAIATHLCDLVAEAYPLCCRAIAVGICRLTDKLDRDEMNVPLCLCAASL